MCGISGAFALKQTNKDLNAVVKLATNALINRGPDGGSVKALGNVQLGHRRLSIIDTSCAGDQPMSSTDGRYTIVFNGEIFNFKELQNKYLTPAETKDLKSHSDTEIFLFLYIKLKEKAFELLDGFFAAAIYDAHIDELVLVRDRYGKKPLLIYQDADKLLFASEMKALFKAGIPKRISWNLLPVYLQLNYIPQPYSLIEGVRKLKAAHYIVINSKQITEQSYYKLEIAPARYRNYSYEQAQLRLVDILDSAVQKRLIADVPLGSFLSGGVDSSVVVALAARHVPKLRTFSIGYKDNPFFDETSYAQLVAQKYNTDHTVFSLSNHDFLEHIHNVLLYIDEPFADSSAIPEYILSYHTRNHVTVALSGDGGDEVFAGYNKHAAEWKMRNGGFLSRAVASGAPLWRRLPHSRNNRYTNIFRQLHRFSEGRQLNAPDRYWRWATFQTVNKAVNLLHPELRRRLSLEKASQIQREFTSSINGTDFNEVLLADMNLVLLSDMLVKVDMMSMANSLEIRSPFLDHHVVDFAFTLPAAYKIDASMKKRIVQDAFKPLLPAEIYNRPKKGFEIPLLHWFRNELWSMIDSDLLSDRLVLEQQIFDVTTVRNLKKQLHSSDPGDSPAILWGLVVFQYWWKHYIAE